MITLRPVCPEDEALLYQIYVSTRAEEMALVHWSAAQQEAFLSMQFNAQRQSYRIQFPEATYQMILRDEHAIGRLIINRADNDILLMDIALLSDYRNAGIGTQLLQDLQAEATRAGQTVRLHVETFNPALRLYLRLGFTKTAEHGLYWAMAWCPPTGKSAQGQEDGCTLRSNGC